MTVITFQNMAVEVKVFLPILSVIWQNDKQLTPVAGPTRCNGRMPVPLQQETTGMSPMMYDRLSRMYDALWGDFTSHYVALIEHLIYKHGLTYARIADLACGTGSLVRDLGMKGHIVHGVDIAPSMIKIARKKTRQFRNVTLRRENMIEFTYRHRFDIISCTFDSINYLAGEKELQAFIKRVSGALKTGGSFVFDLNTEHMYATYQDNVVTHNVNGESFIQRLSYNPRSQIATAMFEFPDGTIEVHQQRPYDARTIKRILARNRMRVVKTYADFSGSPFRPDSHRLICIAEKKIVG